MHFSLSFPIYHCTMQGCNIKWQKDKKKNIVRNYILTIFGKWVHTYLNKWINYHITYVTLAKIDFSKVHDFVEKCTLRICLNAHCAHKLVTLAIHCKLFKTKIHSLTPSWRQKVNKFCNCVFKMASFGNCWISNFFLFFLHAYLPLYVITYCFRYWENCLFIGKFSLKIDIGRAWKHKCQKD